MTKLLDYSNIVVTLPPVQMDPEAFTLFCVPSTEELALQYKQQLSEFQAQPVP